MSDVMIMFAAGDLPAIGNRVNIIDPDGELIYGKGESGEVIAHIENTAVVRMSYGLGCFTVKHMELSANNEATEDERQRIDIAAALKGCGMDLSASRLAWIAARLFDAGCRMLKMAGDE